MSSELKCLRCSSEMELGSLSHREQLYPTVWWMRQAQEPTTKFGFRRLSKEEFACRKAERAEVLQRCTYVDAYRCPNCGHVELSATRKVVTDNKQP
jgi:DNA-directed RNA polymerase subunit RPC12/RpoP